MSAEPTLETEYATLTPLQVRIDTHQRYSEHPDDPDTAVLNALALTGTEVLADIGCGTARFLARLATGGHSGQLIGVDQSPAMVAAARAVNGVHAIQADASRLGFDDGELDVLTARHMLYHLPEPIAALAEFRRVTRPGGTVAVVVNHARTCWRTHDLVASHARNHGIAPVTDLINDNVTSDTLPDMMHDTFGTATVQSYDNALLFREPGPLIAFAEALFVFCGITADHPARSDILAELIADIERWFADHPGQAWRDPKGYTVATSITR